MADHRVSTVISIVIILVRYRVCKVVNEMFVPSVHAKLYGKVVVNHKMGQN